MSCPNLSGLDDSEESLLGRVMIEGFVGLTRQHVVQNGSLFRLHPDRGVYHACFNREVQCTESGLAGPNYAGKFLLMESSNSTPALPATNRDTRRGPRSTSLILTLRN